MNIVRGQMAAEDLLLFTNKRGTCCKIMHHKNKKKSFFKVFFYFVMHLKIRVNEPSEISNPPELERITALLMM